MVTVVFSSRQLLPVLLVNKKGIDRDFNHQLSAPQSGALTSTPIQRSSNRKFDDVIIYNAKKLPLLAAFLVLIWEPMESTFFSLGPVILETLRLAI